MTDDPHQRPDATRPADAAGPDATGAIRVAPPIVGLGAGEGGLDAIAALLSQIGPETGLAIALALRLDPADQDRLPGVLARSTTLPVVAAADGGPLEPNRVYHAPPGTQLAVARGRIRLATRPADGRPSLPIDTLFRSIADDGVGRGIGVVLSGSGTDGSLGLRKIKDADGLTFVQDPATARNDAMPRSALATGCADHALTPDEIGRELGRIARSDYLKPAAGDGPAGDFNQPDLHRIFGMVRARSGVDFSRYKRSTILRRIQRRMALGRYGDAEAYLHALHQDPDELDALHQDFLIRVTSFFRDPAAFEALQNEVFPILIRERALETPIRIWVAGCSTGEEVYSLAIALLESLGDAAHVTPIKILATDVNERALEVARAGVYLENAMADLGPDRVRRHFIRVDGAFQISKMIRDLCVFSRHDLTRDPPFARLDLIACRNLMIYLDVAAQKRIFPLFHYGLRPGGYLMLGSSESIGTFGDLFATLDGERRLFIRRPVASRPAMDLNFGEAPPFRDAELASDRREGRFADSPSLDLQREADRILLARYTPPGVLVDEDGRILQFRGRTEPFLAPAPGSPSFELMKMARDGLKVELRAALDKARYEAAPVRVRSTLHGAGAETRPVDIHAIPLRPGVRGGARHFLVLFEEAHHAAPAAPLPVHAAIGDTSELSLDDARRQVTALRREIDLIREYLQSVIEENEVTNEELKSANEEILSSNEELQSTNEELQSTNEELQTAKEEMQSANEELSTVNEELNHRNAALGRVNDDLLNLFASVNIPLVMVSRDLRIRRFTPPAERLLNLIATDVGRPIDHIRPNIDWPDLAPALADVIETLAPRDVEVRDRGGRWYSARLRPYITAENRIDGAVVAIVDVDELKRGADQVRRARDYAEAIIDAVTQPLVVLDQGLTLMRANAAFYRTFRLAPADTEGRPLGRLGEDGPWSDPTLAEALRAVIADGRPLRGRELEGDFGAIGRRTIRFDASQVDWRGGGTSMVLLALEDTTDLKREVEREQALLRELGARLEAERANRKKDEFLAMLAHELRNPLSPILNALVLLRAPDASPTETDWAIRVMERQVRHMARLVDDLLDVSRVIRGKIELRREPVALDRLVRNVVEMSRPEIEARRHALVVVLPSEPLIVQADPLRIEQVVNNL